MSTHVLWCDEVGGGVSIRTLAQRKRARTCCGRTKWEVGSASDLKGRQDAQAVEGQSGR